MFGDHFYHETIKRSVSVFGTLFNNISIKRADGTTMKVPLAYGPKEKFLVRLDQQSSLDDRSFALRLPRIGFEISGIEYDPTRKLNKMGKYRVIKTDTKKTASRSFARPRALSHSLKLA